MKKKKLIIIIILLFVSFLFVSTAIAKGDLEFQKIPWLCNENQVTDILKDNDYLYEDYMPSVVEDEGIYIKHDDIITARPESIEKYRGYGYSISFKGGVKRKIAGYSVNDLLFTFAKDGVHNKLISVKVELEKANYNDLLTKLHKVYGNGETRSGEDGSTTSIWCGDNNSCIILYMIEDGDLFNLIYGRFDAEGILSSLQNSSSEIVIDPDDVSGL